MKKLEIHLNGLEEKEFKRIQKYINSREFQKDFHHGYFEKWNEQHDVTKYSGKILKITGQLIPKTNIYTDVKIVLREGEDLDYSVVRDNLDKLAAHYQKIINLIFYQPNTL